MLKSFSVTSFEPLDATSLAELAAELSAIEGAGWKSIEDPWAALADIRGDDTDN